MSEEYMKKRIQKDLGDIYETLKREKAILAGGAILSLVTNKPINDYDIYFTQENSYANIVTEVYGVGEVDELAFQLLGVAATNKSLLMKTKHSNVLVQFIHYMGPTNVEAIFDSFDFTVCQVAYDFASGKFIYGPTFWEDTAARRLVFNPKTTFPIVSMQRVDKYKEKGYSISRAESMRIALTIAAKDFTCWEDVENECTGMYGLELGELFDKTTPFSLMEAVDQLSRLSLVAAKVNNQSFQSGASDFDKIVEASLPIMGEKFQKYWEEELSIREVNSRPENIFNGVFTRYKKFQNYDEEEDSGNEEDRKDG